VVLAALPRYWNMMGLVVMESLDCKSTMLGHSLTSVVVAKSVVEVLQLMCSA